MADFPLSAVKTPKKVLVHEVRAVARVAEDRRAVNDGRSREAADVGGVVNEKCVTCVDPAARPVAAVTHASTVAMASSRRFFRMTLPLRCWMCSCPQPRLGIRRASRKMSRQAHA